MDGIVGMAIHGRTADPVAEGWALCEATVLSSSPKKVLIMLMRSLKGSKGPFVTGTGNAGGGEG